MSAAENIDSFLRIGDIVTLFHGKSAVNDDGEYIEAVSGGWLCAEGQLGEDCMLTNNVEYMQVLAHSLFRTIIIFRACN